MTDWRGFLEKFTAFGRNPSIERYVALFDAHGTVFHPGMAAPIGLRDIPIFITNALTRLSAFQLIPVRCCVNNDTIFVEANNTAAVAGKRIVWPATYCITLRGDRVLRGRAYYDRTEVLAHFDPTLAANGPNVHATMLDATAPYRLTNAAADADTSGPGATEVYERFLKPYMQNWQNPEPRKFAEFYWPDARMINPGFDRVRTPHDLAAYYIELKLQTPDLHLRLETWAASPGLLFVEWTALGTFLGKPLQLPVMDRFTLQDFRAVEGVAYFDALALRVLADPALAHFGDISASIE